MRCPDSTPVRLRDGKARGPRQYGCAESGQVGAVSRASARTYSLSCPAAARVSWIKDLARAA
jgi:hypothetical protein